MRVLVTGSAGFIGSALSLRLLERGLAPVYLVFGDEPLQLREAADAKQQVDWRESSFEGLLQILG